MVRHISDLKPIPLADYIGIILNLSGKDEKSTAKARELIELHGDTATTYEDIRQALDLVIVSVLKDADITNKVQEAFNLTVLDVLEAHDLLTSKEKKKVINTLDTAVQTAYKDLEDNNG